MAISEMAISFLIPLQNYFFFLIYANKITKKTMNISKIITFWGGK